MFDNIEKMYQELLQAEANSYNEGSGVNGLYDYQYDSSDDIEVIGTSAETAKEQEKIEKALGDKYNYDKYNESPIEERLHFKRYSVKREHKYTETEMKKIREECEAVIVHDYGENDIYHMSDEERQENDMLAEISMKLRGIGRIYHKVDQYVEAMRVVTQAWEILEKNNYIHPEDEFFQLVAEGKIVSSRIIMPKLKRKDKYNMDLIIKYISNPELNPADLRPEVKDLDPLDDDFYTDMEENEEYVRLRDRYKEEHKNDIITNEFTGKKEKIDDYELEYRADNYARNELKIIRMEELLTPEEALSLNNNDPCQMRVKEVKRRYIKDFSEFGSLKSKKKKFNKKEKYIRDNLHLLLNKIQTNPKNHDDDEGFTRSYMLTHNMFETDKPEKDVWDDIHFEGSLASDSADYLYNITVREKLMEQHPLKDRYQTYADKELSNFFKVLEDHGVSTLELSRRMDYTQEEENKKISERKKKENRKMESQIIQRITKQNNDPKFKKLVAKAEKALNKAAEEY